ncbi:hypothetical protein AVEN_58321-1 [Araneus ventricosus]|uniref:Uncharacterized protein n=1 Tax=Araneus ventricosus TaxID=182803 RepID=A0A4Y2CPZ8_ARAVE|nr:hypothetical protein AVEN_58321-1 [Araneus ventricosus]
MHQKIYTDPSPAIRSLEDPPSDTLSEHPLICPISHPLLPAPLFSYIPRVYLKSFLEHRKSGIIVCSMEKSSAGFRNSRRAVTQNVDRVQSNALC